MKINGFTDKMASMNQEFKRENKNSEKKENRENNKVRGLTDQRDKQVALCLPQGPHWGAA